LHLVISQSRHGIVVLHCFAGLLAAMLTGCPAAKDPAKPVANVPATPQVEQPKPEVQPAVTPETATPATAPAATPPPSTAMKAPPTIITPPATAIPAIPTQPDAVKPAPSVGPTITPAIVAPPAIAAANNPDEKKPAKSYSPIFEEWPQPKIAFFITGEQLGYIEPCGCAGLENQKGGLSRRQTLLEKLRADGWPLVPVDLGSLVSRSGRQTEIKFDKTAEALKKLGYEAIAFGPEDLRLPAGVLAVAAVDAENSRFVSANVGLFGFDSGLSHPYRVVQAGGMKIGITSVLGAEYQKEVNNDDVKLTEAEQALEKIVPKMQQECDYLILLSHAKPAESRALAKKFPQFKLIITAGGASEPPHEAQKIAGSDALLVEVGHKGMYAIVIGLFDDKDEPVRYQRVPLDSRFADSVDMKQLMVDYQQQLESEGFEGLGLRPIQHPSGRKFVGSAVCAECHTAAQAVFEKTPHAHATQTLVDLTPSRHFDPECLSCHTTGWEPQKFFPFDSGYLSLKSTPLLQGNGCENCHGPGSVHAAIEKEELKVDDAEQTMRRVQMRLTLKEAEDTCLKCHDTDNSPAFKFETYWPKVEHKGKL
jgi:hypothetical protein